MSVMSQIKLNRLAFYVLRLFWDIWWLQCSWSSQPYHIFASSPPLLMLKGCQWNWLSDTMIHFPLRHFLFYFSLKLLTACLQRLKLALRLTIALLYNIVFSVCGRIFFFCWCRSVLSASSMPANSKYSKYKNIHCNLVWRISTHNTPFHFNNSHFSNRIKVKSFFWLIHLELDLRLGYLKYWLYSCHSLCQKH